MFFLTEDAILNCKHELGIVAIVATQSLVTVSGRKVLVEKDPEGRPIAGCPNIGATIKPCTSTLVADAGYSDFIRIEGKRTCLDTITGFTDGTPPGVVKYQVKSPGQNLVTEEG